MVHLNNHIVKIVHQANIKVQLVLRPVIVAQVVKQVILVLRLVLCAIEASIPVVVPLVKTVQVVNTLEMVHQAVPVVHPANFHQLEHLLALNVKLDTTMQEIGHPAKNVQWGGNQRLPRRLVLGVHKVHNNHQQE